VPNCLKAHRKQHLNSIYHGISAMAKVGFSDLGPLRFQTRMAS